MWPFSNSKNSADVSKEIDPSLTEFFEQNNPEAKHQSIFELSPQQKRVNQVLLKHENDEYNFEFDKYKKAETPYKVASINCAELLQKVMECFRTFKITSTNQCREEIGRTTACSLIQNKALQRLHYDDCVSTEQCDRIRFAIDKFFTQNFGQYGDKVNPETQAQFNKDLDGVFYKIWK